ncbi:hypothetical protein [Corallococcus carmarthensis]|uniref:Outer membrane protein beta-barrel domain-containing protein n=1 Tax=Corallococcus carmarthensis TaxID=2316728 RepID=A0A3A8JJ42_9BACT|nr:hypothetical protein [Corallococcus carmarthensis]NOK21607.1 hypothetical protein [Corallococcus carmarthensis]RKG95729.1 hypothetical protein D7X32_38145 [Corallococcus carmarthensis]
MSFPKVVLGGGLLVGLLAAPPAEARFGKKSDSNETSKPVHKASAIGADKDDDSKTEDENKNRSAKTTTVSSTDDSLEFSDSASDDAASLILGAVFELLLRGMGEAIANTGTHHGHDINAPDAPPGRNSLRHAVPFSFRAGVLVSPVEGGSGLDFDLGWDVHRFGADLRVSRLLGSREGSASSDTRTLGEMHVTYSPLVREDLRLRVEAGVATLDAPGRVYVAPSLGMSVEACVLGPLDAEARLQVSPGPYQQVDARAGLALHLGSLMLRGGARYLALDSEVAPLGLALGFAPEFGVGFTF